MKKLAVLVSGGVDSSVALHLAKLRKNYKITAFYLKIWLEDDFAFLGDCPWEDDIAFARSVCDQLEVPLEIISLQSAYWDKVVSHTVAELKAGRTPSPDILCNQQVKFGAFCDYIDADFDILTGHYARLETNDDGTAILKKGIDPIKDQSYFLSRLSQQQLQRIDFPIGHLAKSEVRKIAASIKLANSGRRDSQGICFLGKIKYNEFVKVHLGVRPGAIVNWDTGREMGTHEGFWFHTIGQRKGLGLSGGPWFVVDKDCDNNVVYVSHQQAFATKQKLDFAVTGLHWLSGVPGQESEFTVKIRHGQRAVACQLELAENQARVKLAEPDGGIAPGQYAVFYQGERCLGSGIIASNKG